MPEWSSMVKYYTLEPDHLPIPHGPNIVVIEGVDTEEYIDPKTKQTATRHRLYLAGWEHPLRLNNMRIEVLQKMFGPRVEDAFGRKIALLVATSQSFGEVKPAINIHPFAPADTAPPVDVPFHLATRNPHRLMLAGQAGVGIGRGAAALPGRPAAGAVKPAGRPLGDDAAAELCLLLRERGKDWGWLAKHFRTHAMADLVDADLPRDCDVALRAPAWGVLKDLHATVDIPDRAAAKAKLIASWSPDPAMVPDERDVDESGIPF